MTDWTQGEVDGKPYLLFRAIAIAVGWQSEGQYIPITKSEGVSGHTDQLECNGEGDKGEGSGVLWWLLGICNGSNLLELRSHQDRKATRPLRAVFDGMHIQERLPARRLPQLRILDRHQRHPHRPAPRIPTPLHLLLRLQSQPLNPWHLQHNLQDPLLHQNRLKLLQQPHNPPTQDSPR